MDTIRFAPFISQECRVAIHEEQHRLQLKAPTTGKEKKGYKNEQNERATGKVLWIPSDLRRLSARPKIRRYLKNSIASSLKHLQPEKKRRDTKMSKTRGQREKYYGYHPICAVYIARVSCSDT